MIINDLNNLLLLLFIWFHLYKKKTEQNKIFLVQEEIIMTPNEMAEIFCVYRDLEVKTFLPHIRWHELDVDEQMMQKTQQLTDVQGQLK